MMGLTQNVSIFQHDCNNAGGGVAFIINKKIHARRNSTKL